jgi:hypothetical protein
MINRRHQQQQELTDHSVSHVNLSGNLDTNRIRARGNLGLLTPAALQRHLMLGSVFCSGAASSPGMALSQLLARWAHFEDAAHEAETAISHVDGAEKQITEKKMTMRIL